MLALLGLLAQITFGRGPQVDESARIFALPMARDTRELAAAAETHLRNGRYPEAILALQRMLEDHAQEVLPGSEDAQPERGTYPGASEWALQRMLELPEAARTEYRARYGPRAQEALERARRAPTRSSLVAIARRWPLAQAAFEAWWTLGDLELEAGQLAMAELAWRRASELGRRAGLDPEPEAAARRLQWIEQRVHEADRPKDSLTVLPRGDVEPWTTPLDMSPFPRRGTPMLGNALQPLRVGDTVLVGTTLRLYALDAFTGEPRWQAGPPHGWGSVGAPLGGGPLFEGIDWDLVFLKPAAGDGIALAVLQEPFTENDNQAWQGIQIMTAIPERRLHAFDLETGHELWNHAPEHATEGRRPTWDGSGTYAERMMIAGSPVVAGARVLVPCYRMQGRIDYHVACYELHTGELLWSALVLSGQRERNMFGRPMHEFCASPLVVSGNRVVAQTELGTLAALDLFTGSILWQTTYRQIPLPKTKSYTAPQRALTWTRLAPPCVVGDVLVAAPSDSNEILAVNVNDGKKLWAYSEEQLQGYDRDTELLGFNLFLGADEDAIYLSGAKLSALWKPGGIGSSAPFQPRWTKRLDRPDTSPRVLLLDDVLLAPNAVGRTAFDRRTGEVIAAWSGGWGRGEAGCLWAGDGALFSLSNQQLSGYLDWGAQLERARRAVQRQGTPESLRSAAELFLRRGRLSLSEGSLEAARSALEEARATFARLRAGDDGGDARGELDVARSLAEVLVRLQRRDEALAILEEARPRASNRAELAALLFQEERLLRDRGGAARIAILDEIEECWGSWTLPQRVRDEATERWLASDPEESGATPDPGPLPTALWTALERADEHERALELGAAMEDLHAALERCEDLRLARGVPAARIVRNRISACLARPGGREAYAPIEERAAQVLASARERGDAAALEHLCDAFPHARAATEALTLLVEKAHAGGDPRAVAALVGRAMARGGLEPARETELLLVLARALGRAGNAAYERGLVSSLARAQPETISPLEEHGGHTLRTLAKELGAEALEPGVVPVDFDGSVVSGGRQRMGQAQFVGTLRRESQRPEDSPWQADLYATRDEILAFASEAPGHPAWKVALGQPLDSGPRSCATAPGHFVYSTRGEVVALDPDGVEHWRESTPDDGTRSLEIEDGVVVLLSRSGTVRARDAVLGLPLWERSLGEAGRWTGPVLGDGHAAFFSQLPSQPPRIVVLDLYRGTPTADVRLSGFDSRAALEDCAWIVAGRLIVPSFQNRPAQLAALQLDGGLRAWTVEFGRDEDLQAIVHHAGRAWPITLAAALGAGGNGGVYELDPAAGTLHRVVPLKPGERLMGIGTGEALELEAPFVFTCTHSDTERSVPIRAIHLQYGTQWTWSLPVSPQEIYDVRNLPQPAVSAECVAIAYQTRRASGGQDSETMVVFLDKRAGKKVDTLLLTGAFAQATRLELRGLGESLFVLGSGSIRGACLEILEKLR